MAIVKQMWYINNCLQLTTKRKGYPMDTIKKIIRTVFITIAVAIVAISATATARATITVEKAPGCPVSQWYVTYHFLQSK